MTPNEFERPFWVDEDMSVVCRNGGLYDTTDAWVAAEICMAANVIWQGCAYGAVDPALQEAFSVSFDPKLYGPEDVQEIVGKFAELDILDLSGINARFNSLN